MEKIQKEGYCVQKKHNELFQENLEQLKPLIAVHLKMV